MNSSNHSRMCSLEKQCVLCANERIRVHRKRRKEAPFCIKCKKYSSPNHILTGREYFNGWICEECVVSTECNKITNAIEHSLDTLLIDINIIQIVIDYTMGIYAQCMNKKCNETFMILNTQKQIDDKGNKIVCYTAKYMNSNETQNICGIPSRVFCSKCVSKQQFSYKRGFLYYHNGGYCRTKRGYYRHYKWTRKGELSKYRYYKWLQHHSGKYSYEKDTKTIEEDRPYKNKIFNMLQTCKYGNCMNLDLFRYCGNHKCSICHTRTISNNLQCERCRKLFCDDCMSINGKCKRCNISTCTVLNDTVYKKNNCDKVAFYSDHFYYGHSDEYTLNEECLMNNYVYKEFGHCQYELRAKVKRSYSKKSKRNTCKNEMKKISYYKQQRDKRGKIKLYKRSKYKKDFHFQRSKYHKYYGNM